MRDSRVTRRDLGFLSLGMLLTCVVLGSYLALVSTRAAAAEASSSRSREINTLIITRERNELRSELKTDEKALAPVVVKGSAVVSRHRQLAATTTSSSADDDGVTQGRITVSRPELSSLRLFLTLAGAGEGPKQLVPEVRLETPPQEEEAGERQQQLQALLSECDGDGSRAWASWRDCVSLAAVRGGGGFPRVRHAAAEGGLAGAAGSLDALLLLHPGVTWAWQAPSSSNSTAVLVHPSVVNDGGRRIRAAVRNVMDNLPTDWRLQVVGGHAALSAVVELLPVEVALGKVLLTHDTQADDDTTTTTGAEGRKEEEEEEEEDAIRRRAMLMTDPGLYRLLAGDTWLFFGLGSAICSASRHKLDAFVSDTTVAWWAAPRMEASEAACGHGGFSLRRRQVVEQVLSRSSYNPHDEDEGQWFCRTAQEELSLLPPPTHVAASFAVRGVMDMAPFAVDEPWTEMGPPTSSEMRALVRHCPELIDVLPTRVVEAPEWQAVIATLDTEPKKPTVNGLMMAGDYGLGGGAVVKDQR